MSKSYWNGNGEEQAKYNEMLNAGFSFTKKTETVFHSYYRYFNDGDLPGWARKNWRLQRYGRFGKELNDAGIEMQEQRVTEAILSEYKRFEKIMKGDCQK